MSSHLKHVHDAPDSLEQQEEEPKALRSVNREEQVIMSTQRPNIEPNHTHHIGPIHPSLFPGLQSWSGGCWCHSFVFFSFLVCCGCALVAVVGQENEKWITPMVEDDADRVAVVGHPYKHIHTYIGVHSHGNLTHTHPQATL
jgi:hypothetical protein